VEFRAQGAGGASAVATVTLAYEARPAAHTYGCGVNPAGSILVLDGIPALGRTMTVGVHNPLGTQTSGSTAYLVFSTSPAAGYPCGIRLPGWGMGGPGATGELLVDPGALDASFGRFGVWTGVPTELVVSVPGDPILVGARVFGQGLVLDPTGLPSVPRFGLTDAIELTIGYP